MNKISLSRLFEPLLPINIALEFFGQSNSYIPEDYHLQQILLQPLHHDVNFYSLSLIFNEHNIQSCFSNKSYTFNAISLFEEIYKNGAKKNVAIE